MQYPSQYSLDSSGWSRKNQFFGLKNKCSRDPKILDNYAENNVGNENPKNSYLIMLDQNKNQSKCIINLRYCTLPNKSD